MIKNISFTGHTRIQFYAQHPKRNIYVPVLKKENIRKCQRFVIQNLNGTAKEKNQEFINFYKQMDRDYARNNCARTVYEEDDKLPHLITGSDTDYLVEIGKTLGMAKADAFDKTGKRGSYEEKAAQKQYYQDLHKFLKNCKKVRDKDGDTVFLNVFFKPKYSRTEKLKGFEYVGSAFQKTQNLF